MALRGQNELLAVLSSLAKKGPPTKVEEFDKNCLTLISVGVRFSDRAPLSVASPVLPKYLAALSDMLRFLNKDIMKPKPLIPLKQYSRFLAVPTVLFSGSGETDPVTGAEIVPTYANGVAIANAMTAAACLELWFELLRVMTNFDLSTPQHEGMVHSFAHFLHDIMKFYQDKESLVRMGLFRCAAYLFHELTRHLQQNTNRHNVIDGLLKLSRVCVADLSIVESAADDEVNLCIEAMLNAASHVPVPMEAPPLAGVNPTLEMAIHYHITRFLTAENNMSLLAPYLKHPWAVSAMLSVAWTAVWSANEGTVLINIVIAGAMAETQAFVARHAVTILSVIEIMHRASPGNISSSVRWLMGILISNKTVLRSDAAIILKTPSFRAMLFSPSFLTSIWTSVRQYFDNNEDELKCALSEGLGEALLGRYLDTMTTNEFDSESFMCFLSHADGIVKLDSFFANAGVWHYTMKMLRSCETNSQLGKDAIFPLFMMYKAAMDSAGRKVLLSPLPVPPLNQDEKTSILHQVSELFRATAKGKDESFRLGMDRVLEQLPRQMDFEPQQGVLLDVFLEHLLSRDDHLKQAISQDDSSVSCDLLEDTLVSIILLDTGELNGSQRASLHEVIARGLQHAIAGPWFDVGARWLYFASIDFSVNTELWLEGGPDKILQYMHTLLFEATAALDRITKAQASGTVDDLDLLDEPTERVTDAVWFFFEAAWWSSDSVRDIVRPEAGSFRRFCVDMATASKLLSTEIDESVNESLEFIALFTGRFS